MPRRGTRGQQRRNPAQRASLHPAQNRIMYIRAFIPRNKTSNNAAFSMNFDSVNEGFIFTP